MAQPFFGGSFKFVDLARNTAQFLWLKFGLLLKDSRYVRKTVRKVCGALAIEEIVLVFGGDC